MFKRSGVLVRGGLFAFGDQHADRGIGIDMMQNLGHGEELPDRGAAFDGERGEVGPEWLHRSQLFAQPHQEAVVEDESEHRAGRHHLQRSARADCSAARIALTTASGFSSGMPCPLSTHTWVEPG